MNPETNGKLISSLDTRRSYDVNGQAVFVDRVTEVLGIRAVTNAHPSELSGISRSLPGLIKRLG
jgi:hypothetical protein